MLAQVPPAHSQPSAKPAGTLVRTAARSPAPAQPEQDYNTTVNPCCVGRHNDRTKTGGPTLDCTNTQRCLKKSDISER
jgi:hypothetical protein